MIPATVRRVFLVALAFSSTWAPQTAQAAEEPDLKLELVGFAPGNTREVQFKVTNISVWWANETTASFETVSPAPANARTGIFVENLDPGHSTIITYALAAPCDGHVIKGEVAAAKNYAGVLEISRDNNRYNDSPCPKGGFADNLDVVSKIPGSDPSVIMKPKAFEDEITIYPSEILGARRNGGEDSILSQFVNGSDRYPAKAVGELATGTKPSRTS